MLPPIAAVGDPLGDCVGGSGLWTRTSVSATSFPCAGKSSHPRGCSRHMLCVAALTRGVDLRAVGSRHHPTSNNLLRVPGAAAGHPDASSCGISTECPRGARRAPRARRCILCFHHSLAEQVPVGAADLLSLCDRCSPEMHPRCARPWLAFLLIAVGRRLHTLRWVFARYDSIGRLGYRRAEKDMLCPGSPRGTDEATPASACGVRARCYQDRPYSLSQTCLTVHPPGPTAPRSLMLRTHGVHGV